ncbi:2-deoxy-scyllo-inosamine dehydrogenase [Dictyobacter sp. S3.2.2.5]|uniref:2-deoxy-scyllo-inosamine dehydrogenase n=1 Tax=Dictyobacter halimunensis TaxID=3026934 RepID=A0ABQ6FIK5_9CHLR|nr:2-deoxy-scyllo-inosamine dehydrogenase [Dictyobacter sp. S3.2.2.5]
MKAIVYDAPRQFSYRDVPTPEIESDEVRIRVRSCGICGTDLHIHEGEFLAQFPLIPGHEFAGEIEAIGSAVSNLRIGERVVCDNTELCGHCFYCRRDEPLFCENFLSHGCNIAGGQAEYVTIKAEKVFPIQTLSWEEAALVEPTACAIHGMDMIALKPGSEVLLFGAGPTGIILAQLLKLNGAAHLTVAAPAGPKLDLISRLAADEVVQIDREAPEAHREHLLRNHRRGFDYVIEATGAPYLIDGALQYARPGGHVVVYGVYPQDAQVHWNPYEIFQKQLTITGSFAQTHCFDRALAYLESRKVKVNEMVTHAFALEDYGKALETLRSRQGIKTIIQFS